MLQPGTSVVPFHYPHPVTGKRAEGDALRAPIWLGKFEESELKLTLDLPEGRSRMGPSDEEVTKEDWCNRLRDTEKGLQQYSGTANIIYHVLSACYTCRLFLCCC